ncbi:hypothetical protein [Robiginitalea marina]|uniref:Uncharacterized protein n=1 Tax=Robiginitalea marina TaxID=2954105 RepID=A0ABT1B1F6_9FLAO|nr:hypothetical protein [Robiginitalea marina]MCO5726081.1 hypothetical protein [Robiginitalea marina]
MKRILHTLKEKWPEYLLEIVVLVIGIYGAFELSNYGEGQARRRAEIEILKGCRTELLADLADIDLNISELQKSMQSINLVLGLLEGNGTYHDSLSRHFNYTLLPLHFVHSTSSFEMLKSKGLDLVSNPGLRARLVRLYDSQYDFFLAGEAEELAEVQYGMRHIFPGRFESGYNFEGGPTLEGTLVPLDFEALKKDAEYLYFLKTQRNRTRSYLGYFYANLENSVTAMIAELDTELARLEQ